jgi:hypothetical protein
MGTLAMGDRGELIVTMLLVILLATLIATLALWFR